MHDLRFAVRHLRRRPGFTAAAALTLALGIGANTAIFSVLQAVLLRPLGFPDPDRLVKIVGFSEEEGEASNLSPADFLDFERENTVFDQMGALGWVGFFTITIDGRAERLGGVSVTEGFFPTLGVRPALGRLFTPEEDLPNGPRVAIMSDGLWRRGFGADPAIVGRVISINARPATVVGVLPVDYRHIEPNPERAADIFMPQQFERTNANRGGRFIRAVARLKAGASIDEARSQLVALAARYERQYPQTNTDQGVAVSRLHDAVVGDARPALLLLGGAVGFVLLVACANVANLLLAGGAARQRELAMRAALGAGRSRLVRQLVTESLVLSGIGAAAGLALASWATRALTAVAAASLPRTEDIRLDGTVVAFASVLAVATGLVFGLLPAWQLARVNVTDALKVGGRAGAGGLHRSARGALVVAEIALSLVLLVGAGLLIKSFWRLQSIDPGFASERVLAFQMALPSARYPEGTQIPFYEEFYDRVRALAGVRTVGAVSILPLTANYDSRGVQIEDRPQPAGRSPSIQVRSVSPGYFTTMRVPLVRGRLFDARDRDTTPLVVVVSESMARQYWPGRDPVGRRVTFNGGLPRDQTQEVGGIGSREIVGIVGDVKHLEIGAPAVPVLYTPQAQPISWHEMTVVVRSDGDPGALVPLIRRELASLDPEVPLFRVRTLDDVLATAVAAPRLRAGLVALFALLALTLAVVGVYGVVSYVVTQRTSELGLRVALGARGRDVLGLVVAQSLRPVAVGMAMGLAAALALGRLLTGLLFDVTPGDVSTYVVVCAVLGLAALAATLIPAWRAVRVDPLVALRTDG